MFSAIQQNAFKAILSIFRHFYFFSPPPHQTQLEIESIFGVLRGKNENVLELSKNHFKDF